MNKKYIYIDGKVIISDENGEQKLVEYYDKLDDILVQENLIETIEDRIAELEKESKSYKKYNRKRYIPTIFLLSTLMSIGTSIIFYTGTNMFMTSVNSIFGVVNQGILLSSTFSAFFLSLGALMEFGMYEQHKNSLKNEKGVNSELEFLKKQLIEEKQVLEVYKKDKKRVEEVKEFKVAEVDDKQLLNTLKSYSDLYFDLGYNVEKYFKYYQEDKLDKKLRGHYTDNGIEIVKEYLEENEPTLVKRKKGTHNIKKQ